jgi:lipopolysaccharide transport system ATP-binding protein
MGDIAIKVDELSKHYRLGAGPQGEGDFRDAFGAALRRLQRKAGRRTADGAPERRARDLWALQDVSFEVRKGEVVGIIGHNGAGKSTLLKILSRITDPTSGYAWFEGRVGSLLEVGTGFHPELSGRENVFLSGAILGMTRREIASKFDEIVEFSEMGRFIDTPVKRYSSGMYVRLGFAVAAHLEPEVLIVDEVLAVGDAAFQRKCMAKMQDVSNKGRTILFVSHNMGSIQALCDRAIVLKSGGVIADGDPLEAIKVYLKSTTQQSEVDLAQRTERRGRGRSRLVKASICVEGHEDAPGLLVYGQPVKVRFEANRVLPDMHCTFAVYDALNRAVCRFSSRQVAPSDVAAPDGAFTCEIPDLALVPGNYHVNVALAAGGELEDHIDAALAFQVEQGALDGRPLAPEHRSVVFVPRHRWLVPGAGS